MCIFLLAWTIFFTSIHTTTTTMKKLQQCMDFREHKRKQFSRVAAQSVDERLSLCHRFKQSLRLWSLSALNIDRPCVMFHPPPGWLSIEQDHTGFALNVCFSSNDGQWLQAVGIAYFAFTRKTWRGHKRNHTMISVVVCTHTHQGWVQAGRCADTCSRVPLGHGNLLRGPVCHSA